MTSSRDAAYMKKAVLEARKNLRTGEGGPFGACVVREGRVIAVARNTVLKEDATCHAEVNAIRIASRKLGTHDLSGCEIYSTTEPCPMCFSAIHWASIGKVYFGTTIGDVQKLGFNELSISNVRMKKWGKSPVRIQTGVERAACAALLQDWKNSPRRQVY